MDFNLTLPQNISFKRGGFLALNETLSKYGGNILVITYPFFKEKLNALKGLNLSVYASVEEEPTVESIREALKFAKDKNINAVLALGGGSVIDTAKAVSALTVNDGDITEYLESGKEVRKIINNPLPLIAVPTTSGTGSECTKNAVISSKTDKYKRSFRDARLLPKEIIIDAELLVSMPKSVTASSGMDAIIQIIESFTTKKANAFTDGLCLFAAESFTSLKKCYDNGSDIDSREKIALLALISGITLANAGLGAAHGLAAGLGIETGIPHGQACAMLMPLVMRVNMKGCEEKYCLLAQKAFNENYKTFAEGANALAGYVEYLQKYFKLGDIKDLALSEARIKSIVKNASVNSMSGNVISLANEQWEKLLGNRD